MSDVLQSILESAAGRHQDDADQKEFLHLLMQQTASDLNLSTCTVWTHSGIEASILATIGSDPEAASDETVALAPNGGVRIASVSDAPGCGRRLLSGSELAGNYRVILDITEGTTAVDHELLVQLADVFADVQRRRILDKHLSQMETDRAFHSLIAQLHSSLNHEDVANALATDGAAVLNARRISVTRRVSRQWEVIATTGVSQPNERSDAARQICEWVQSATDDSSKGLEDSDSPAVIPLETSGEWSAAHWAAVFETEGIRSQFTDTQIARVCTHATLALNNCETLSRSTLANRLKGAFHGASRRGTSILLGLLVLTVVLLSILKTDLRIEVYGELTPQQRSFVFAPEDGTVMDIQVEDGSEVVVNQKLCVLTNEDLELRRATLDGELAAATARLAAIDALRGDRNATESTALLSAEQAELNEKTASLISQIRIVKERISKLEVTSRIAGRVHGDRLRQLLFRRPVQRGQFLFEVASHKAGWQLDLRVAEADVRHILQATEESDQSLPVTFALETSPEEFRTTRLTGLATATDLDNHGVLSTLATAALDGSEYNDERPGAGVIAYIHCGQRSMGFVWFRKVIESIQRNTWL